MLGITAGSEGFRQVEPIEVELRSLFLAVELESDAYPRYFIAVI